MHGEKGFVVAFFKSCLILRRDAPSFKLYRLRCSLVQSLPADVAFGLLSSFVAHLLEVLQ